MALRSCILLITLISISLSILPGQSSDVLIGGKALADNLWEPIKNVNDPFVQKLAKNVVDIFNRIGNRNTPTFYQYLFYKKVVKGETKKGENDGKYYRMIIAAKEEGSGAVKNYQAIVFVKHGALTQLISFNPV